MGGGRTADAVVIIDSDLYRNKDRPLRIEEREAITREIHEGEFLGAFERGVLQLKGEAGQASVLQLSWDFHVACAIMTSACPMDGLKLNATIPLSCSVTHCSLLFCFSASLLLWHFFVERPEVAFTLCRFGLACPVSPHTG